MVHVIFLYARQSPSIWFRFPFASSSTFSFLFFFFSVNLEECSNGFTETNADAASLRYFILFFVVCISPGIYWILLLWCDIEREEWRRWKSRNFVLCVQQRVREKKKFSSGCIISLDDREGPHMVQWETDSAVSTSIPAASSFNLPKKKKVKRKKKELRLCRVEKKRPGPRHTGGGVLWIMH
jgi:hypothetical protein